MRMSNLYRLIISAQSRDTKPAHFIPGERRVKRFKPEKMTKPSLSVLLSVIVAWGCDKGQAAAIDFDHFILAFQWPVTFCENTKCGIPLPDLWTIHGFWPSNTDGSPVQDCSNANFDEQQIPKETRVLMNKIWPDLLGSGDHSQFWSRQWKKHGTCADVSGTKTVAEYFTKATQLANQYNLAKTLADNHINEGLSYKVQVIEDAINNGISHKPYIQLREVSKNQRPLWLFEIRICFNKMFGVIDCHKKNNYKGNVLYPRLPKRRTMSHSGQSSISASIVLMFSLVISLKTTI